MMQVLASVWVKSGKVSDGRELMSAPESLLLVAVMSAQLSWLSSHFTLCSKAHRAHSSPVLVLAQLLLSLRAYMGAHQAVQSQAVD